MKAIIEAFDKLSGEGIALTENNRFIKITAAGAPNAKTCFKETACVYYKKGQEIEVEVPEHGPVLMETRGHVDSKKWSELDHSRLAFKCNEEGKALNGLFK